MSENVLQDLSYIQQFQNNSISQKIAQPLLQKIRDKACPLISFISCTFISSDFYSGGHFGVYLCVVMM